MPELSQLHKDIIGSYSKVAKKISDGDVDFTHINYEHVINHGKKIKENLKIFLDNPSSNSFKELWKREYLWAAQQGASAANLLKKNGLKTITEVIAEMNNAKEYNEDWEREIGARGSIREFWGKLKDKPLENGCADVTLKYFGYDLPSSYRDFTDKFEDYRKAYLNTIGGKKVTKYPINIEVDQLTNVVDKLQITDLSTIVDDDILELCGNILKLKHGEKLKHLLNKYIEVFNLNPAFYIEDEGYKFDVVSRFRDKFNLKAENFGQMLEESLKHSVNLIQSGNYYPGKMLLNFYEFKPQETKAAIIELLSRDGTEINEKVNKFTDLFEKMLKEMKRKNRFGKDVKNTYIDYRFVSFILSALEPDKYFYTKYAEYSDIMKNLEPNVKFRETSQGNKLLLFNNFAKILKSFLAEESKFLNIHKKLTKEKKYKDNDLSWGVWDFIFNTSRYVIDYQGWIFQGNPDKFDVLNYIKDLGKKDWAANQNREKMRYNDKVYFWKSGENAGIYGCGNLAGRPQKRNESDPEKEFGDWKVDIDVNRYLGDDYITRDKFKSRELLAKNRIITNPQGSNFILTKEEVDEIEDLINDGEAPIRYWQIAPGENARFWKDCLEGGFICVGWDKIKRDLSKVKTKEELGEIHKKTHPEQSDRQQKIYINQLWDFLSLKKGDLIVANRGQKETIGVGKVVGGYRYDKKRDEYRHLTGVEWFDTKARAVPSTFPKGKLGKTILELTKEEFEMLTKGGPPMKYYDFFSNKGYVFPKEVLTNYLVSLKTKPFVILTGISGTGKTKIAQLLAEFFTAGKEKADKPVMPSNEEGIYYYKVNKSFIKYGITLSREMESVIMLPEEGKSKDMELLFDGQSDICRLSYVVRSEAPDCSQIRFRKSTKDWIQNNLKIGDYVKIDVLQEDEPEEQKIQIEKYEPETRTEVTDSNRDVFISVRPDWMDCKGLLGFFNLITQEYQPTEFLKLLLRAKKEYNENKRAPEPYFVILDEMNLAKVEYYFSDFLSCLESRRVENGEIIQEPIILHDQAENIEYTDADGEIYLIPPKLEVPPNVYFTGTVNVDETTYMFSPKVLDRANVIEFNQVHLEGYAGGESDFEINEKKIKNGVLSKDLERIVAQKKEYDGLDEDLKSEINNIHEKLEKYNMHFGYRVANEIATYLNNTAAMVGKRELKTALDLQILQKILPKLHGSKQSLEEPLIELFKLTAGEEEKSIDEVKDILKSDELDLGTAKYPRSARKIKRMLDTLNKQGFVSFIE